METEPVPSAISSWHRSQIQSNRSLNDPTRRWPVSAIAGRSGVVRRRAGALSELALCGECLAGVLVGRGRIVRERRYGCERVIAVERTGRPQIVLWALHGGHGSLLAGHLPASVLELGLLCGLVRRCDLLLRWPRPQRGEDLLQLPVARLRLRHLGRSVLLVLRDQTQLPAASAERREQSRRLQ